MAKGMPMGLWKGKKGSSVFYRIKNSNNAQKQGVRERVYDPSNPKTSSQAGQRMKMRPAQAVFGILKDIIKRSFEGVSSGMARQEFMKYALSSNTTVWPALMKNDNMVVPGDYLVAKGTLTERSLSFQGALGWVTNINSQGFDETPTFAQLSEALLQANPDLQDGDQITFIVCVSNASGDGFYWYAKSLNIDTNSDYTAAEVEEMMQIGNGISINYSGDLLAVVTTDVTIQAGALIVSRDAATPKRSMSRLSTLTSFLPEYYSNAAKAAARRSYMAPESAGQRDWEVQPSDGGRNTIPSTYTIEGLTNPQQSIFNGEKVLVYVDDTTGELVAVGTRPGSGYDVTSTTVVEGPCVCDANGNLLTRSYSSGGEVLERNLLVSAVSDLASLRQVPQV